MIRWGHIELFVPDPVALLPFYRDLLGFSVTTVQGGQFVWLALGAVELLLRPGHPPHPAANYAAAPAGYVLYTDDLSSVVQRLRAGGVVCQPLVGEPDCYVFTDPAGHWFQLVDPGRGLEEAP